ncbi:pilus assembly protein [Pseudocolwellia sp. HL-MZ7]|uniref:pilus assembly protein n=1 Tax=Pseudocolwellia sp. HL-MZ7 TaxID=3400627 RepID=UPI003CF6EB7B
MRNLRNIRTDKRIKGQGMVEYIIIVALIAISAIAAFTFFGDVVRGQVGTMASELGGKEATASSAVVTAKAALADTQGATDSSLADYSQKQGAKKAAAASSSN